MDTVAGQVPAETGLKERIHGRSDTRIRPAGQERNSTLDTLSEKRIQETIAKLRIPRDNRITGAVTDSDGIETPLRISADPAGRLVLDFSARMLDGRDLSAIVSGVVQLRKQGKEEPPHELH